MLYPLQKYFWNIFIRIFILNHPNLISIYLLNNFHHSFFDTISTIFNLISLKLLNHFHHFIFSLSYNISPCHVVLLTLGLATETFQSATSELSYGRVLEILNWFLPQTTEKIYPRNFFHFQPESHNKDSLRKFKAKLKPGTQSKSQLIWRTISNKSHYNFCDPFLLWELSFFSISLAREFPLSPICLHWHLFIQ